MDCRYPRPSRSSVLNAFEYALQRTLGRVRLGFMKDGLASGGREPFKYHPKTIEYDGKASAIKSWGTADGRLAVSTVVFDPQERLTASCGTHGEYMQISVGTSSDTQAFSRLWVYRNGVLAPTREVKSWPMKADGAANGSQPFGSETNRTSSAAGFHR